MPYYQNTTPTANRYHEYCAVHDWFSSYDWRLFATLTIPPNKFKGREAAKTLLQHWTRRVCTTYGIQIGYIYVMKQREDFVHFHLLLLTHSSKNAGGCKLLSYGPSLWPYNAKIEPIIDYNAAVTYCAKHILKDYNDEVEYDFYNQKLLNKRPATALPEETIEPPKNKKIYHRMITNYLVSSGRLPRRRRSGRTT